MKISEIEITNFKAIRQLKLSDLGDVIVIAGPNGCGKSCIFDAIRFLKSAYGGYGDQDETQSFFNEFLVDINNPDELRRLFFDATKPINISATITLSTGERDYIKANAERLVREILWKSHAAAANSFIQDDHHRETSGIIGADIGPSAKELTAKILDGLAAGEFRAQVKLDLLPEFELVPNAVLEFVFGIYEPANIGVIDFHSPNRAYQRERVGGINVSTQDASQRLAQHALYNSPGKYNNIKSELAAAYIRDLIAEKAGATESRAPSILKTMTELFELFLPGKRFLGPVPGSAGQLKFPVKLAGGGEHDIDDLSSGEKELAYGYLRLRNVSPSHSIILLDEPELHLNPRLIIGLPGFYRRHLGAELGNQLWMTTHSDAFLRDAYQGNGFTIFHMSSSDTVGEEENQAVPISAGDEIDRAVVDLVGDIAGYRPGNKIVIFESSESASYDALVTKRIFPDFAQKINAISGDNEYGVRQLYTALNKAVAQMSLPFEVFAITDRDSSPRERPGPTRVFSWDVYHIENYLLSENFIQKVIDDHPTFASAMSLDEIAVALKECAKDSRGGLVRHLMHAQINAQLMTCLDLGYDPQISDPSVGFSQSIEQVAGRIDTKRAAALNPKSLAEMHDRIEAQLDKALNNGEWRSEFKGRDILRRFAGKYLSGLPYEAFRDAIVARMSDANYQPSGMKDIIEKILNARPH